MTTFGFSPELSALMVSDGVSTRATTPEFVALWALDDIVYTPTAFTPELNMMVVLSSAPSDGFIPTTPEYNMYVVYGEGSRVTPKLRAWAFIMDGHTFYVLSLGMLGTYVCDVSNGFKWSQWNTEGMETWNAEAGLMWQDMIVAGDNQNPALWQINPDTMLDDDFKPIRRTATALIPARGRKTVTLDMFNINASAGYPTAADSTLTLSFSDDSGETWTTMPSITMGSGDFNQNLQFASLGSFGQPGRIINISDFGGAVRLSDADVEMGKFNPWAAG